MTVRPLSAAEDCELRQFYLREPIRSITVRLNIEAYGYSGKAVRSWGVFEKRTSRLSGVLLHFGNTVVVTDSNGECASAFAKLIETIRDIRGVRGSSESVIILPQHLKNYHSETLQDSFFLRLDSPPVCLPELLSKVRRAGPDDLDNLEQLYLYAEDMYRSRSNLYSKLRDSRVWIAEDFHLNSRKRIVSAALINVEGEDSALIGGVYTHPEFRGRGYAAACTAALSIELQNAAKTPLLFYENPTAGRIYRQLGFNEIDSWRLLYLKDIRK